MIARPQLRWPLGTDAMRPPWTAGLGSENGVVQIGTFQCQADERRFTTTGDDFDDGLADAVEGHFRALRSARVKTLARFGAQDGIERLDR